ncbi:MAG: hypothetical protein K2X55_27315, partial [Burkholderiaceae bacterium]|nr:hypothetical protein [Burkholderiaceae bacterium]
MTAKAALHQAIVAAFNAEDGNTETVATALTEMLCAFADVTRGPAVEFVTGELVADDTLRLVLAELRKQTTLLEVIAKQGEHQLQYISDSSDPLRVV